MSSKVILSYLLIEKELAVMRMMILAKKEDGNFSIII